MDKDRALQFIRDHSGTEFYQPVIFEPGILEIRGKWNTNTKKLADIVLSEIKGLSVLDVGCNTGFFLREAERRGASKAVGIDNDASIIQIGQQINDITGSSSILLNGDLTSTEVKAEFDVILMLNILHLFDDPKQIIKRFRNLSPARIFIEHEPGLQIGNSIPSPRAVGHRSLTVVECQK